jgi:hypothetical protein
MIRRAARLNDSSGSQCEYLMERRLQPDVVILEKSNGTERS